MIHNLYNFYRLLLNVLPTERSSESFRSYRSDYFVLRKLLPLLGDEQLNFFIYQLEQKKVIRTFQRSYDINFFDPICTNSAPEILECNSTIDRSGKISFYMNLKRDLPNLFVLTTSVFDGDGYGKQNLVYINKTVNICTFLANRRSNILLRTVYDIGETLGELPKRCPLKKKLYFVAKMKVTPDNLPPFMPIGNGTYTFTTMAKLHGDRELKTFTSLVISYKVENTFKGSK